MEKHWDDDDLLTPGEVASLFRVDPKTATRWARGGRLPYVDGKPTVIRTPGGHMRFRYKGVRMILSGEIEMTYNGEAISLPAATVTRQ